MGKKGKNKGKGNEDEKGAAGPSGAAPAQPPQQPRQQQQRQPQQQPKQPAQQPPKQPQQQQQQAKQSQQRPQSSPSQATANEVEILVPGNKVGLVIGKGGETIKKLQNDTGTKMWIVQESRSADSKNKPLRIAGDPTKVAEARRQILEIIGEDQGGSESQRPQQGPPGFQQRPQQGPSGFQQRPQQGPSGIQQQPQQGPPGFQQRPQQGPPGSQRQPVGSSPSESTQQAPKQRGTPPTDKSDAGLKQSMEKLSIRESPPSEPSQPSPQRSSPEKPGKYLELGLPQGTKGRDYPALNSVLPKRADRPPSKKTGRALSVDTNHLLLKFNNPKQTIYHYDVKIEPERPFKFYRPALQKIREKLYPRNYPSFDGKKNLYSVHKLPFRGDSVTETVEVFDPERDRLKEITVTITLASQVTLESIQEYMRGGMSTRPPQDAIQALDICLRQPAAQRFLQVGRSYFSQPSGRIVTLGDGINLWYGFFQSAIIGWRPFLNIDVAHKGFPAAVNCVRALEDFAEREIGRNDTVDDWVIQKMRGLIKGLKVVYEMPGGNQRRTHKVLDLGRSARATRFTVNDNGEMTVEQYFKETYNYIIKYPNIPCLTCGTRDRQLSLPAELCTILEGQVVMRKLNEVQTRNMVRAAATPAFDRKKKIMDSMYSVKFNSDPHVREFGVEVSQEMTRVDARVLNAPSVYYSNKKSVPVNKGVWMSSTFIRPGNLDNWVIYNCERRVRPGDLENLERNLMNVGRNLGMSISKATITNLRSDNVREVERDFADFQKKKVQLLFVILPDRGTVTYAKIKLCAETQVGVLTQCLKSRTVSKLNPATTTNILLKVNAKINGINHHIDPAFWPSFLRRPVMVVGADVTHPSPDQQDIPSVAAVAASHDANAFHYNMKWRLQQPREEMIQDLQSIMKEQLMFFYRNSNRLKPEHILFYRDGVSEGQFKTVLDVELQAIRAACQSLSPDYKPPITFLVVQKRHHTRFFPSNPREGDPKNGNVPAGTIVDTDIVHPTEFDFYLVSHASIQGTARPTKYHVLWDDAQMPEQLLEEITYYLCHLFTRCTRSVSYPAPTYYAHLAAFRIRSYIENQHVQLRNLDQETRNRTIKDVIVNNNPMFFV